MERDARPTSELETGILTVEIKGVRYPFHTPLLHGTPPHKFHALPKTSREKKWVDGILARGKRLGF